MFKVGDIVRTKEDEFDIGLVPAGTILRLYRENGECWYGYGDLGFGERPLLIVESNLELVNEDEVTKR